MICDARIFSCKTTCINKHIAILTRKLNYISLRIHFFCRYFYIHRSGNIQPVAAVHVYAEIQPCRVLSAVNPSQTAKLFGASEFLRQRVLAYAPSTRRIKSAGLLSRRVGSSTGMKYRFSIEHSLTLGRFRIKLLRPWRESAVYSAPFPLVCTPIPRYILTVRSLMGIGTFATYLEKRVVIPIGTLQSGQEKQPTKPALLFIHLLPFPQLSRCIYLGKALMRPGRSVLYPVDRLGQRLL